MSTVAKFGALALLVLRVVAARRRRRRELVATSASTGAPVDAGLFGLALISVLWAYDGFADLSFASGEVKDPAAQPAARHHLSARWRSSPST